MNKLGIQIAWGFSFAVIMGTAIGFIGRLMETFIDYLMFSIHYYQVDHMGGVIMTVMSIASLIIITWVGKLAVTKLPYWLVEIYDRLINNEGA